MQLKINDPILDASLSAAKIGGQICRDYFEKNLGFENKDISNLVTEADIESEKAIVSYIQSQFPDHAILD